LLFLIFVQRSKPAKRTTIMAQAAPSPRNLPDLKLPKIDLDAVFGLQKANLATAQEAQNVLLDAAQAIVRAQYGWAEEAAAEVRAALNAKAPKQPEAVLAEVKAAAEKAVAVAKESVDLGVMAQRRVADLLSRRAAANVEQIKVLAAA
jgi:hypothetical protein